MERNRYLHKNRTLIDESEGDDPTTGVVNLFDVAMVLAVSLMVAMVTFMNMTDFFTEEAFTVIKNPGQENMEIIRKEGEKIEKFKASDVSSGQEGRGRRVGTAYELETGEIIYIPE
ncbi:hypothetical protein CHISP_0313 [Chitinispirillum alkaliphilum]|nr:hypothetical protein CHISP_0313 [Chitinispirillum alkaliphilum]